jgi:quinoprotein glucose dehydrogenase
MKLILLCILLAGATAGDRLFAAELLPVEDAAARAALPEYIEIPAARPEELTPANGWPALESYGQWHRSHGGPTSNRFSTLTQINRDNVKNLELAWVYHSQDGTDNIQCNAIVVDGVIYVPTGGRQIAALDAATGRELWKFAPELGRPRGLIDNPARRGLMWWPGDAGNPPRILFTCNYWIYALDPKTGTPLPGFGTNGRAHLPTGGTVGGAVYKNVYVVPGFEGDVFGYDVRDGRMLWRFHTIPREGEFGFETWDNRIDASGANCWGGMALDESRGIAYIPTGSVKPNFSGLTHLGDTLFGSSLIAINALTGERIWHFQGVRHDIWDLDMGSPPNLVTVTHEGRRVDAVAQIDKNGTLYLLDRVTGKPLFPFRMRRAPTSRVPGEVTAPYQPSPVTPEPVTKQVFERSDITDLSPEATAHVEQQLARATLGFFDPPDLTRPIVINGLLGGTDWPGSAFDPRTGYLYIAANQTPWIITLRADDDPPPAVPATAGERTYQQLCVACHGPNREGLGVAPPLVGLRHRLNEAQIRQIIQKGIGAMPVMPVPPEQLSGLVDFLLARDRGASVAPGATPGPVRKPIAFNGYPRLLDHEGYPGGKPPWGMLICYDLNQGRKLWQVPLGEYRELTARGIPQTGTENLGGATVTAGGLVFVGGTRDNKFRAFDATNGQELWSHDVPSCGTAPPTVYEVNGRQYVVLPASGGGHLRAAKSDAWLAFALPVRESDTPPAAPAP